MRLDLTNAVRLSQLHCPRMFIDVWLLCSGGVEEVLSGMSEYSQGERGGRVDPLK